MVITLFFISIVETLLIAYLIKEVRYQKTGLKLFNDGLNKFAELFSKEVNKTDTIKDNLTIADTEIQNLTREIEILKAEKEELSLNVLSANEKIEELIKNMKAITGAIELTNAQSNIVQADAINKQLAKQFSLFDEWLNGASEE